MSIVIGILAVIFYQRLLSSNLARGNYSLKAAFWGWGVFGGMIVYGIGLWNITNVFSDISKNQGNLHSGIPTEWVLTGAIDTLCILMAIYSALVFLGIWRSASKEKLIYKFLARYISSIYFFMPFVLAINAWVDYLIMGATYFFFHVYLKKTSTNKNINQTSTTA